MVKKVNFLEVMYKMSTALDSVIMLDEQEKLENAVLTLGYTVEELKDIDEFINKNITKKEFDEMMIEQSILKYTEALGDIKELISQMEKGYVEMGNINSQIAEENAHIIDEGVSVYEMGTKDAETGR